MTMLGASVLFMRGKNTHNQLSQIVRNQRNPKYVSLLEEIDILFSLDNTRENREKLQRFIIKYGEEIYREFSKFNLDFGNNDFGYDLKNTND